MGTQTRVLVGVAVLALKGWVWGAALGCLVLEVGSQL